MDYKEPILDFLQQPENLPLAIEVSKQVEALRLYNHQVFWQDIYQALKKRLEFSDFADRWTISGGNVDRYDEAWRNLQIRFGERHNLAVCLMQGNPAMKYQLYYGLCWDSERAAPVSNTFQTLIDKSKSAGVSNEKQSGWWPLVNYMNMFPRSDEFILQYSPAFINELADRVWDYFLAVEPTLFQLNQELK